MLILYRVVYRPIKGDAWKWQCTLFTPDHREAERMRLELEAAGDLAVYVEGFDVPSLESSAHKPLS